MKKSAILVLFLNCSIVLAQTGSHHDQQNADPFTLSKLTENVYSLAGRGGNIGFFIGPDAVVMVDSQFKDLAPGIEQKIKTVTDKPIKYLVNTHYHGDHVGGNEYFIRFAVIIAHDEVRKRVLMSPRQILERFPQLLEEAKKKNDAQRIAYLNEQIEWAKKVKVEEIAAPFLTFNSEFRIHLGGETIQVWHTPPAHTDGDSVVYFEKAKVVHMGDLFFHKRIPFIDVEGGGSAAGYMTAIDHVLSRIPADVKIIPGHGEVTDINGLKGARQYIQDLVDAAKKAKAAGKTKEQFVQEVELPAYKDWDGYENRFKENAAAAWE